MKDKKKIQRRAVNVKKPPTDISQYKKRDVPPVEKFYVLSTLCKKWISHLSPPQFMMVMFMWHRTYHWGKKAEFVKLRHITHGVKDSTGALPLKKRAAQYILKDLVSMGVLLRQAASGGAWYMLNMNWKPDTEARTTNNDLSKRASAAASMQTSASPAKEDAQRDATDCAAYKYNNTNNKKEKIIIPSAGEARMGPEGSHGSKLTKIETVPELEKLWHVLIGKTFPEMPTVPWTAKERGQLKGLLVSWKDTQRGPKIWPFLDFCIREWAQVKAIQFKGLTRISYPQYPSLGFVMSFLYRFVVSYAAKGFEENLAHLPPEEQHFQRLLRKGHTPEEAERVVMRQCALGTEQEAHRNSKSRLDAVQQDNVRLKRELNEKIIEVGRHHMTVERLEAKMNSAGNTGRTRKKPAKLAFPEWTE